MEATVRKMSSSVLLLFASCLTVSVSGQNLIPNIPGINKTETVDTIRAFLPEKLFESGFNTRNDGQVTGNKTECDNHLQFLVEELRQAKQWAMKMVDSSSKLSSGILAGNLNDLGMYDECVTIEVSKNDQLIRGRHCMYTLRTPLSKFDNQLLVSLSICLPSSCGENNLQEIVQSVIDRAEEITNQTKLLPAVTKVKCSSIGSKPWGVDAIIVLSLFGLFFLFLLACTACEFYCEMTSSRSYSNPVLDALCQFSLYANARKCLSMKVPRGNLPSIAGLRFVSMTWVILGHEYFLQMMGSTVNQADFPTWTHSWNGLYIMIAPFTVDTFFAMSGFLTSYLFMKEIWKGRSFNPVLYYLHRYFRLTPALGVLLLFSIYIVPRMGSGAIWETNIGLQEKYCSKNWWTILLYIQNFGGTESLSCLGHIWYLAVDMHFFWISPLILYPLAKRPKIGVSILGACLIASIIVPAFISVQNKYSGGLFTIPKIKGIIDAMVNFYIVSYTRAGPWLMGIFLGYKLAQDRRSLSIGNVWIGWMLTAAAFLFCIFSFRVFQAEDYEFNDYWEGFYNGLARHIWAYGICWIIYASAHGYGGIISKFLSLPIFLPFGRISYCIYLVHYVIELMRISSIRVPNYFSDLRTINTFLSDYVLILVVGFIFSLVFESPFLVLERMILGKKEVSKIKPKEEPQGNDVEVGTNNNAYEHKIEDIYTSEKIEKL